MTTHTGPVGRLMKFTARPGRGADLAGLLLRVADALDGFPGCLLYAIGRDERSPDVVHVTELWRTAADADAALASSAEATGSPAPSEVLALVGGPPGADGPRGTGRPAAGDGDGDGDGNGAAYGGLSGLPQPPSGPPHPAPTRPSPGPSSPLSPQVSPPAPSATPPVATAGSRSSAPRTAPSPRAPPCPAP
ncbi:putative quinol monooxygenase [Streptomyces sp. SolWspMP-sol7th]|uniref:putative quinol monooxygenase n=1 Tax=Streptomyces sp. SolWspMP-sol7th TaxID=1839776 RepID=UPI0034A0C6BC